MKKQLYLIGILIIAAGIYYFMSRPATPDEAPQDTTQTQETEIPTRQPETEDPKEEEPRVISEPTQPPDEPTSPEDEETDTTAQTALVVYAYANADTSCTTPVAVTPATLDTRYEYPEINAIVTLLNGNLPTGYQHIFASGTMLRQLSISQSTANIDLNSQLAAGDGACTHDARVQLITQTLLQFPDIENVVVTVDGG